MEWTVMIKNKKGWRGKIHEQPSPFAWDRSE